MIGNSITYYDRNFSERINNPEIAPDFIYTIWYQQSSEWCYQYQLASFKTMEQLKNFALLLNFTFEFDEEKKEGFCHKTIYNDFKDKDILETVDRAFNMAFHSEDLQKKEIGNLFLEHHFKNINFAYNMNSESMAIAKPFLSLSNGHIVKNYFVSTDKEVRIYRCNPNAKDFYKPLSLDEQIVFNKEYGSY